MPGGVRNMKGEKQMIYKNIRFKAAPFSYDLTFDDRITLVGGDSGTGKTVLYEMLEDIRLFLFWLISKISYYTICAMSGRLCVPANWKDIRCSTSTI